MTVRSSPERPRQWVLNQRGTSRSWLPRILLVLSWAGRAGSLFFIIFVSLLGLITSLSLLSQVRELDNLSGVLVAVLNALGTIVAWAVLNTAYGLYYAYLYYRSEGASGGLTFPGDEEPNQLDIACFSFATAALIGSDVMVTIRRCAGRSSGTSSSRSPVIRPACP